MITTGTDRPRSLTVAPTGARQTRPVQGRGGVLQARQGVELIALNPDVPAVNEAAERLYTDLQAAGVEVF